MTDEEAAAKANKSPPQREAAMRAFFDGVQTEQALHRAVLQNLLLQLAKQGGPEGLQAYRDDVADTLSSLKTSLDPLTDQTHQMEMQTACEIFFSQIAKAAGFAETREQDAN